MSDDEMYYDSASEGSFRSDDEDMIDGTQDDNSAQRLKGKGKARPFHEVESQSLSVQNLESDMKKDAEHVAGIFGVSLSAAYILLKHMQWNKERLIEKYMDDPVRVLSDAGVPDPGVGSMSRSGSLPLSPRVPSKRGTSPDYTRRVTRRSGKQQAPVIEVFVCPICCDENPEKTLALSCGHTYCSSCWETYIHTKIRSEGECAIQCMNDDCHIQIDDNFLRKVAAPRTVLDIWSCSCVYAVSCPTASTKGALETIVPTVQCADNHKFCFGCQQAEGHAPCMCAIAKMWLKKCADDSETANWIKSNTKECTKCQSTIEKNGGCNHMTCKKCKNEFCWVCMGSWAEHGNSWYSCNRYDEKESQDARDAQSRSRASLERYLHYYNRWANHEQSSRLTLDLYAKTEKKMEEMQITSNLTWIEVQFAKKAVDEVTKCRTTLKWTYAMAYYLESGNAKQLFEDNQADLEKAVEDLSELLESQIEPETIPVLRQKMTDKTVYVAKRNDIVLEDTAKGFAEGRWSWNSTVGS
ncbi:uncharacterized protein EI90DRAFT_3291852 [Cantharellus anzutake]|uniref:uncharacterized protein n=1 Tax=Cantharellus anzutake TaxID=1750568 RepID=UPI0019065A7C|nr:uncharacterized protein EI90DRAFT_3291852 [Cantharellus anzutake]KAF8325245.1 hypothetical protein EI90DRAFT_3291852 [Cantharellus anzutake]